MASGDTLCVFTPESASILTTGTLMVFNLRNGHLVLEATNGTSDGVAFAGVMPQNYTAVTGIGAYVTWTSKTVTSGTIGWDVTFERNSGTTGDDITADHWQTAQSITAATVPAAAGLLSTTNVLIGVGLSSTASIAAGDAFRVRVRRLSGDSAAGVAQLLAVELREI